MYETGKEKWKEKTDRIFGKHGKDYVNKMCGGMRYAI